MDKLTEMITSSTQVFQGRLLKVNVEEVRLGDGQQARREVVYHPGAVAVVPLKDDGKVAMVRQYRLPARKVLLEIPAGVLDEGESPEECAERELAEEVGYKPARLESLGSIFVAPGYSSEKIHIFLARGLEVCPAEADVDERLEPCEMTLSELLSKIDSGEIEDGKTVVGLLLAKSRLCENSTE